MEPEFLTMQEMCEAIVRADVVRKKDGTRFKPQEIFELSPTGELDHVFCWYRMTRAKLEESLDENCGPYPA